MPIRLIPCAPGAHIGEQIARDFLEHELAGSHGILLSNYHHISGNGTQEYDLLLINERGVWAIEVKHWVGRIDADQIYWMHNGYRHQSPVVSVETKAKSIASALRDGGLTNISVVGIVLLTNKNARFGEEPPDDHQRKVFRLTSRLTEALTGNAYRYRATNQNLTPATIQRVADLLVQNKVDPERRVIGSFRLLRELEPVEGFKVYEAQHVLVPSRRARVKRYQVMGYRSKAELGNAAQRFQQDITALSLLDAHPNIVRAYDFQGDPDTTDTYWLMTEWVEGQTLQERLESGTPMSKAERIAMLSKVAAALAACHQRGIIHRNLTTSSILLTDDGQVKVGDFDFARVSESGRTISKTGEPLRVNKYTAPELRGGFRNADMRSDLYALGAIWYDTLLQRPPDEPILPFLLTDAALAAEEVDLLKALLEPLPGRRPASADEVQAWLELIG